jgi:hypothetical protein
MHLNGQGEIGFYYRFPSVKEGLIGPPLKELYQVTAKNIRAKRGRKTTTTYKQNVNTNKKHKQPFTLVSNIMTGCI